MRSAIFRVVAICCLFQVCEPVAADEVSIDYAVFYTPHARSAAGGEQAILTRINAAFAGANELFALSGLSITHRVVHTEELPLNNSSETLPEIGSELAQGFNFFEVMESSQADSIVTIVEFQRPGGFANIPASRRQALEGGAIYLGLPNVSAGILAHEIGHTLGSGHDYSQTAGRFFDDIPAGGAGNHFIGATTGLCYRTIMSALTTCRLPGREGQEAINSNRFSGIDVLFDGAPTGIASVADNVTVFKYFAPLVASARGASQIPATPVPEPTPDDGSGGGGDDTEEDVPGQMPDDWDVLTLQIVKAGGRIIASGECTSADSSALSGDRIRISLLNRSNGKERPVRRSICRQDGTYQARLTKSGLYRATNIRTGRMSSIVRVRLGK